MFPLLDAGAPNPLELFQIWLNLPARSKMAEPHFKMLWSQDIPRHVSTGAGGAPTELACIAGRLAVAGTDNAPPAPPPDSWAAQPESDLAIWTLKMALGARWTLPPAAGNGTRRTLYFFKGGSVAINGQVVDRHVAIELPALQPTELANGPQTSEFLLLQGRPIGEPVAQYGPFVMNTQQELQQAFADYRRTAFGGWPWPDEAPVHGPDRARFARHADGRIEQFAEAAR
jgi:redox-sensitive bicupin YhaK (pirin superfamily)